MEKMGGGGAQLERGGHNWRQYGILFHKPFPLTAEGASDSDSECSSETKKEDIYARVNRRPTPHKKRHKPRFSDGSLLPPPPIPPYTEDRHLLVQQDQLEKGRFSYLASWEGTFKVIVNILNLW